MNCARIAEVLGMRDRNAGQDDLDAILARHPRPQHRQ